MRDRTEEREGEERRESKGEQRGGEREEREKGWWEKEGTRERGD